MRLDVYLQSRELVKSRTRAKEYISLGRVKVNGNVVTKPSYETTEADVVTLESDSLEYVGRGAHKLEGALDAFCIDVAGARCIDVGASTGGFTEVLLRRGAASVTAVDSGHGQLDSSLREDRRVKNIEGCNARYMSEQEVGSGYDIAVMDVSFISQTYIHQALFALLSPRGRLISLVKPQFELDARSVGRGVVTQPEARYKALVRVYDSVLLYGYRVSDAIVSSILGGDGNVEYLYLIERGEELPEIREKLRQLSK